ncbi:MAG TPA: ABC transporter ATP-binding protein [Micromonosporaceae bacterium]
MSAPLIELVGVKKTYPGPPEVHALRDVTLTIRPNEMVAVIGSSGSGKSTLLNIMGLLDQPSTGTVKITGRDVGTLCERDRDCLRASRIGFVFQSFHLVGHLTSIENVTLPLIHQNWARHERRQRAVAALTTVGLGHRLHALPASLSGGEQQRVAVARGVVHDPAIVLCDEPTGNLDRENTAAVLALLRDLVTPERAVVIVTHEREVWESADRLIRVVDGCVTS